MVERPTSTPEISLEERNKRMLELETKLRQGEDLTREDREFVDYVIGDMDKRLSRKEGDLTDEEMRFILFVLEDPRYYYGYRYRVDRLMSKSDKFREERKILAGVLNCQPDEIADTEDEIIPGKTKVFRGKIDAYEKYAKIKTIPEGLKYVWWEVVLADEKVDLKDLEHVGRGLYLRNAEEIVGKNLREVIGDIFTGRAKTIDFPMLELVGGNFYVYTAEEVNIPNIKRIKGNFIIDKDNKQKEKLIEFAKDLKRKGILEGEIKVDDEVIKVEYVETR
jgi:hypothetical protein